MKKFFSILVAVLALCACTSDLEPEFPQQENGSGNASTDLDPSVELSPASLTLHVGESATLTARINPGNTTGKTLTWTSSNPDVASVSQSGSVVAVSVGNCTISVTCDGKKAECEVTVVAIPVSSVRLDVTTADLLGGETLQLTATVLPANATDQDVIWTSSDTDVATVENGLVTALNAGEATITVSVGGCSAACLVRVTVPFTYGGMCMECTMPGRIVISNPNQLTIEYKLENLDWVSTNEGSIAIDAKAGERVWFRGRNESYSVVGEESVETTTIRCTNGAFFLYGNLMSLIYGDDFDSKTELTGAYTFTKLFCENNRVFNHPTYDIILPATTLSASCYRMMFYACTGLTRAPKLPAKVLTEACYASMFAYCLSMKEFPEMAATDMAEMSCTWMMMGSGIEEAPELPAMNLAKSCYEFMFMECPDLKKAMTVLPATELALNCYAGMFQRAEKLENAPVLPATELTYCCYSHMFNGCISLKKAPSLPAMTLANCCYQRMFGNSGLQEAPELPAMELKYMCYQYMFEGCKALEKAPFLPAIELVNWCYEYMFRDCSSLSYIHADFLTKPSSGYMYNWVEGVAAEGTFVKNPEATWEVRGDSGIPEGWRIQ